MTPSNSTPSSHRTLSDDVLQSAEDAVTSSISSEDEFSGLSRGDYVARTVDVQSPYTGTFGSGSGSASRMSLGSIDAESGFFSRMENQVTRYVAAQPGTAALMAAGAGALLALLMGRRKGGRR